MAGETKSNGQKDYLDRFYTPKEIVEKCLSVINLKEYDCIIEPSAGNGSFSNLIDGCFSYDIAPASEDIIQADWLKLDKSIFNRYQSILVIGNPPFGQQNTLALSFIKESMKFAKTVAFILPLSFKKISIQNQIPLEFELKKELELPNSYFILNEKEIFVPCVFQVWERAKQKRSKIKLKTSTDLFDFTTKEQADLRIQRVGGNAGKASTNLDYSKQSNYFIKNKTTKNVEEFCEIINNLVFPNIAFTVGPKSLSKGELVSVCEENRELFE